MKKLLLKFSVLSVVLSALYSCNPIQPEFTFSPESPKAGQKVTFKNATVEEAESWNWTFGDGGFSLVKNTSYIYKKPGIYTITLMADSNKNYVKTQQITVYDTIPSIYVGSGTDTVSYFTAAKFSVLVYNPYAKTVTYDWTFPANAVSTDLDTQMKSDDKELNVFFTKKNNPETVYLKITVGDSVYNIQKKIFVKDVKSRSMLMALKNGNIHRQRIFDNGLETGFSTGISSGIHPFTIKAHSNQLFIFDAGTHVSLNPAELTGKAGDSKIRRIDMVNQNSETVVVNNADAGASHAFITGTVDNQYLYWTDPFNYVYRTNKTGQIGAFEWKGASQTTVPYYLAKADRLGYFGNGMANGQFNGGLLYYDFVYYWAKGGNGRGVYAFVNADILGADVTNGTPPAMGAILKDFAIRAFDIDQTNQKIYFSVTAPADKVGFWVANLSGTNPVRIDDAPMDDETKYITGIQVDNASNRVYWAYRAPVGTLQPYLNNNPTHRSGVKSVKLSKGNTVDKTIVYFAPDVEVYGITIDEVAK